MTKPNDGGPAFPQHKFEAYPGGSGAGNWVNTGGMTLRDWFAGQALAGMLGCTREFKEVEAASRGEKAKERALLAYYQADAMIAAREAKP